MALILVVALVGTALVWLLKSPRPHSGPKPLSDLKVAEAWLQCIDCQGSFLQRMRGMTTSRDTVTRFLRKALLSGPSTGRMARREQALIRTWRADSTFLARRGETPAISLADYVARYRRGFEVMWRSRAATALGVIRGDTAMAALDTAAVRLPFDDKGDTTIHWIIEQAIADSARRALSGSVPVGGPPIAHLAGRVVDVRGMPLANVEVMLVGTSIQALTGNQGQYSLGRIKPGTYTLRFRLIGHQPGSATITVTKWQTITHTFTLRP